MRDFIFKPAYPVEHSAIMATGAGYIKTLQFGPDREIYYLVPEEMYADFSCFEKVIVLAVTRCNKQYVSVILGGFTIRHLVDANPCLEHKSNGDSGDSAYFYDPLHDRTFFFSKNSQKMSVEEKRQRELWAAIDEAIIALEHSGGHKQRLATLKAVRYAQKPKWL